MLVAAFFAAPATAQLAVPDFDMEDLSDRTPFTATFGTWPDNMNFDTVDSGWQNAMGIAGGVANNGLAVKKTQEAGMTLIDAVCVCPTQNPTPVARNLNNKVVNVERVSTDWQLAAALGPGSIANNQVTVDSSQGVVTCTC